LSAQIAHAFRLACSRDPKPREHETLHQLAQKHGLDQACRVLFNTSSFLMLP
jgi:hypothetical protein